jgi:hypothetical protein
MFCFSIVLCNCSCGAVCFVFLLCCVTVFVVLYVFVFLLCCVTVLVVQYVFFLLCCVTVLMVQYI